MMHTLRFYWSIYRRLLGVQVRSQLQYRASFLLDLISTAVTLFLYFGSLVLVFKRFDNLAGWRLGEVAFLWGTVEVSFGLMDMIFSGFDPSDFGNRVRLGTFDQLLLRPLNITVQVLASRFLLRRWGRILQGMVIFGFALTLADIHWTLLKLLYLPCVILGLIGFFGGLFVIGATITFWTIESVEAINIFTYGGSEMMTYPMHIYPDWLRRTFTYVIPAIFLNYYPALFFLDKPDPFGLPVVAQFLSPLVGGGVLLAALAFWRFGIRHYQSTGT
jgi:ABC-2 type transport system permease protein